ncbi:MAG: M15 family metallopeptidase [Pseudomonadota bacterium]
MMNKGNSKTPDALEPSLKALLNQLGIPLDYGIDPWRPAYQESDSLVDAGLDVFERPQQLNRDAFKAWCAMQEAANKENVSLQLISGFRSIVYQAGLIERKLQKGQHIDDILKVNAAPGFSEHHTGCALDLTTPGCEPLEEAFEITSAFTWLNQRAAQFGFVMSYPRNNLQGFIYEPWHWAFQHQ